VRGVPLSRHIALGVLCAAVLLLLLILAGFILGTTSADDSGRTVGGWLAFSMLLAFMCGGYTAARSARTRETERGVRLGGMVFVIASPLILCVVLTCLLSQQLTDTKLLAVLGSLLALTGGPFGGMLAASRRETVPARTIRR
jgi:cytochrome bd-type quinol oxidase subunit 2